MTTTATTATTTTPTASSHPRPPAIPPDHMDAWRAFLTAHARVTEVLAQELRETKGVPLTWYDVLVQLNAAPERRLRMQELADAVVLSKSGLTRLVDRMESEGLVERTACPSDRRGTFAALTDQGLALLRDTGPTHLAGVERHFTSHLDAEQAAIVARTLQRIADAARQDVAADG